MRCIDPLEPDDSDPEWGPLLDTMMILVAALSLMFKLFVVSVTASDLAHGEGRGEQAASPALAVRVDARGRYLVADRPLSLGDLDRRLAELEDEQPVVHIYGVTNAPYGAITMLEGHLEQFGATAVRIVKLTQ